MYNSYFGFKEKPFKLVPNPDYLFMSKSHEIAMAHLVYATDQGDGFVVIAGEVGTGKTTLCRTFLDLLNDQTESAYIFNPKMDSAELLSSICTEFGIAHQHRTVKELIDALNHYLIQKNEAGHKAILIIDEAQNLTVENLEMVRMISNLETTRNKLLQIILMGQPELNDKLDSAELRQLAQRISLNYYLMPLSAKETEAYVHHRINIAAQRPLDLFSSRACRLIHRYAKGIPRLINIACDRALLMAYTLGRNKVTPNIVHGALEELTSRGFKTLYNPLTRRLTWAVIFMALAVIVVIILKDLPFNRLREWYSGVPSSNAPLPAPARPAQPASPLVRTYKIPQGSSEEQNRSVSEEISAQGEDRTEPMTTSSAPTNDQQQELSVDSDDKAETQESSAAFIQSIEALEPLKSRIAATETILLLWEQPLPKADHLPLVVNDAAFFDIVARQYGLRLYRMDNNWGLVKKINLPTIVAFRHSSYGRPVYLVLTQWQSDSVTLRESPAHQPITIDFPSMQSRGDGATFIFWKNTLGFDSVITKGANEQAVLSLKKLLRSIGYQHIAADTKFEDATMAAIMDFQARNRLEVDGLVGSLTKILMINQALTTSTPRLDRQRGG